MAEKESSYTCERCGKRMDETNFYTYKNGKKTEMCKKCLTAHIDNFNPDTFIWLLKKMDVPYIPEEWNIIRDRAYNKDPNKMNGMSVFGKYLSKMKLKQWEKLTWADTERLRLEREQALIEKEEKRLEEEKIRKEQEEKLKEQLEKGEITESQYKTLVRTETRNEDRLNTIDQTGAIPENSFYNEKNFLKEEELVDPSISLTKDDKIYLAMKWGRLYKPSEWIELEKLYNDMLNSFDIQDADSINTLKLICKTSLKANQAIDCGD